MFYDLIKPIIFKCDPEVAHGIVLRLSALFVSRKLAEVICAYEDPSLNVNLLGLNFSSPLGLAAGYDKNGSALPFLSALGFSAVELGTVTPLAQSGNPRPRIFRLPKDKALINRMGFPSVGMEEVFRQLAQVLKDGKLKSSILGINIGKNKETSLDNAHKDYLSVFEKLYPFADYFTVNVSSPNTPELRKLQEPARLKALFQALNASNKNLKPIMLKVAPDLSPEELKEIVEVALDCKIAAIIATNTTLSREGLAQSTNEAGGLSGAPLFKRALNIVRLLYKASEKKIPIIGVGGISNAEEAYQMIKAGASLIQIYSALIYHGPFLPKAIKQGLVKLLRQDGYTNITQAIGAE